MSDGYEESVRQALDLLEDAGELDGFVFAASAGDDVTGTLGTNPEAAGEGDVTARLGMLLLAVAETRDVHPAVVGYRSTRWAVEQQDSGVPRTIEDHDREPR